MISKQVKNFFKNKKVIITGGTGLIGRNVVKKLCDLKSKVTVVSLDKFIVDKRAKHVFGDLTMKENLTVLSRYHNQMIDLNKFNDSLEKLNIKNLSSLPLKFFSQGNLQRNKLLIAMNLKWDYLFVDEPFSNLDYHGIKAFKEIFTSFKSSGKSIIFSTHHIDESKSICDEMIDIKNSTLVRNVT